MSYVANVILTHSIHEDSHENEAGELTFPVHLQINDYFKIHENCRGLVSVEDKILPKGWYGGSKYLEAVILIGAFNYLSIEKFRDHIRSLQWIRPASVRLFIQDQEDDVFRTIRI